MALVLVVVVHGVYCVLLIKVPRCNRFKTGQFPIQIGSFFYCMHTNDTYTRHTASTSCTFERQCILGEVEKKRARSLLMLLLHSFFALNFQASKCKWVCVCVCMRMHNKFRVWRSNVSQYVSTSLVKCCFFLFPSFSLNSVLLLCFFSISFVFQTWKVHVYLITVSFDCNQALCSVCVVVAAAFVTAIFSFIVLNRTYSCIVYVIECTYM